MGYANSIGGKAGSGSISSSSQGLSRQENSCPIRGQKPTVAFGSIAPAAEAGASPPQPTYPSVGSKKR